MSIASLTEIANRCNTDKGTMRGGAHAYTELYNMLLHPLRHGEPKLLEIGLAIGGPEVGGLAARTVDSAPSIRMWREYFPHGHIFGVDISDFSTFEDDRFTFFQADCGDVGQLAKVADKLPPLDVIVDDGSHASYHQQVTFLAFFPKLKSGGLYIIEDLDWVPEEYERSLPIVPRTPQVFGALLEHGEFRQTGAIPVDAWAANRRQIGGILIVDEDTLVDARKSHNTRAGVELHRRDYVELSQSLRIGKRGQLRRLYERMTRVLETFLGRESVPRQPRTKLLIIQKA